LQSIEWWFYFINDLVKLEIALSAWYMSVFNKLGMNKITSKGAELLTKANWNFIQALDIGCNKIGWKGAKLLSRGNWPYLK